MVGRGGWVILYGNENSYISAWTLEKLLAGTDWFNIQYIVTYNVHTVNNYGLELPCKKKKHKYSVNIYANCIVNSRLRFEVAYLVQINVIQISIIIIHYVCDLRFDW